MNDRSYLIAGGGIAGLATALALSRIGRNAKVFEQEAAFEESGAGLQISPNAVHCLRLLGAWDAIEPHCVIPSEIHIRNGCSGVLLQRIGLGKSFEARFKAPYRVAHRADLLGGLLQTAESMPDIALHTRHRVERAENTGHGARLHFASGAATEGACVIGADGVHSVVRSPIVDDGKPSYSGHAIYRALLPFDKVPLSIAADCVTLWLYPGGHAVHYPVSNWRQLNIVAVLDSPCREEGWGKPAGKAEVANSFADAAGPLAELFACVPAWVKFNAADQEPTLQWTNGHIALIGDAAHASLPYLAQGAAMALEDACVLARCLAENSATATALAAYARLRQPRTACIQRESRRLRGIYHARSGMALARNMVLRFLPTQQFLRRNEWIYDWRP